MCAAFANVMQAANSAFETVEPATNGFCVQELATPASFSIALECGQFGRLQLPASAFTGTDSAGEPLNASDSIYLKSIRCASPNEEEVEPNDTPEQAQALPAPDSPIPPGITLTVRTAIDDPRPSFDWFTFTLTEPSTLTIETDNINESTRDTDTQLTLYDSAVNQLAFDDDSGPGFMSELEFDAAPGTYFVKVSGWPGEEWYPFIGYLLTIEVEGTERRLQEVLATLGDSDNAEGDVNEVDGSNPTPSESVQEPQSAVLPLKMTFPAQTFAFVDEIPGRKDSVATAQRVDISDESKLLMVKGSLEESQSIDCYTFDAVKAGKLLHIKADLTSPPYAVVLVTDMEGNPCDTREATEDCCDKSNCRQRGLCQTGSVAKAMTYVERTSCFFEFLQPGKYSACVQRLANTQIANPYILAWVNMN